MTRPDTPFVIAHATDLHPDGGIAFAHGVALAHRAGARLVSLHANPVVEDAEGRMPNARNLLQRWMTTAEGKGYTPDLDHHKMVHSCCDDPVDTLLDSLRQVEPDLLVVGTRRPTGLSRWLKGSASEALALNAQVPTLFVPIGGEGFVDVATGGMSLGRLLVPVDSKETAGAALEVASGLVRRLGLESGEVVLVNVGDGRVFDTLDLPDIEGWRYRRIQRTGNVHLELLLAAEELSADLIVMSTRGHDGLLDLLRGSETERVVRDSHHPVLCVPMV